MASVAVGVSDGGASAPMAGVRVVSRTENRTRAVRSPWPASWAVTSTPQSPAWENVAGAVKIPFESGMSQRNVPASSAVGVSTLAARS